MKQSESGNGAFDKNGLTEQMEISGEKISDLRAAAYKLLADCYNNPDKEIAEKFNSLKEILSSLGLKTEISELSENPETLMVDHARLFVGPLAPAAPPYGSMYMEHGNQLMTESTLNVQKWYESEGMEVAIKDIPDHIRVELEFMYYLVYRESRDAGKAEEWQQKQRLFLEQNLSKWIRSFEKKVRKHAETTFYTELAEITARFIFADITLLEQNQN